jgi:hypothetical protein
MALVGLNSALYAAFQSAFKGGNIFRLDYQAHTKDSTAHWQKQHSQNVSSFRFQQMGDVDVLAVGLT